MMKLSDKAGADNLLGKENLRKTKARKLILEVLKNSLPKTAGEIFSLIKEKNGQFSLSTVYRTCETLAQKGILLKSNFIDDGAARYEYLKTEHTHHAICLGCNKIISIDDCPFGKFDQLMQSKYDFDVKSHRIEIYGYCHDCKQNKNEK
jgi:Fur family transcriptional regulator, ferric uptake regulator